MEGLMDVAEEVTFHIGHPDGINAPTGASGNTGSFGAGTHCTFELLIMWRVTLMSFGYSHGWLRLVKKLRLACQWVFEGFQFLRQWFVEGLRLVRQDFWLW